MDAAAVAADDRVNVGPQPRQQSGAVRADATISGEYPVGHLLVPHEHVADHEHPVALPKLDEPVGSREGKAVGLGVNRLPFEQVLRRDRIEMVGGDRQRAWVAAVNLGAIERDSNPQIGWRQRLESGL